MFYKPHVLTAYFWCCTADFVLKCHWIDKKQDWTEQQWRMSLAPADTATPCAVTLAGLISRWRVDFFSSGSHLIGQRSLLSVFNYQVNSCNLSKSGLASPAGDYSRATFLWISPDLQFRPIRPAPPRTKQLPQQL